MKKILAILMVLTTMLSTNVFADETKMELTGTIQASIIDVDIPTVASFTINPNGPTFTSPDLVITNNSTMPVTLSLSGFDNKAATDNQFTEVGQYDKDWQDLGIHASKNYIYLAVDAKNPAEVGYVDGEEWIGAKSAHQVQGGAMECASIAPFSNVTLNFESEFGRSFQAPLTTTYELLFIVALMD